MPTIELGVNEVWRQGREVVGRHDIIPVATEGNFLGHQQLNLIKCITSI